jgi:hypothetical protein
VPGCDGQLFGRGLCSGHYQRLQKTGNIGTVAIASRRLALTQCNVEGCDRISSARRLCGAHYARLRRAGDVGSSVIGTNSRSDAISYKTVHRRVLNDRGPARGHQCFICNDRVAAQWAYDHSDPGEKLDTARQLKFSIDPEHYIPLCIRCHKAFDREMRSKP